MFNRVLNTPMCCTPVIRLNCREKDCLRLASGNNLPENLRKSLGKIFVLKTGFIVYLLHKNFSISKLFFGTLVV